MSEIYKTFENEKYKLNIYYDDVSYGGSRSWDNLSKLYLLGNYKRIGDKHEYMEGDDLIEGLFFEHHGFKNDENAEKFLEKIKHDDKISRREMHEILLNKISRNAFVTFLFIYDHSGLTINTTGFSCRWDTSRAGLAVLTKKAIMEETGWKARSKNKQHFQGLKTWQDYACKIVESEVKTLDQELTGDVYGFRLFEKKVCETCGHIELDETDSCWGFYGDDFKENGILDCISLESNELNELLGIQKEDEKVA